MRRVAASSGVLALLVVLAIAGVPQPTAVGEASHGSKLSQFPTPAPSVDPAPSAVPTQALPAPAPPPRPPAISALRNPNARFARGRLIEISIATQTLTAWDSGRKAMSFKISTGRPGYRTPKGEFRVRAKGMRWWSRKWRVWMPYAMNFYRNYNLHSLPYSNPRRLIGASRLGRPDSHGCVRIGPANARALYRWTPVGTPVWIH